MKTISTIGIAGGGTMGAGIAQISAAAGFTVVLRDLSEEIISRARATIESNLGTAVEKKKLTPEDSRSILEHIRFSTDMMEFQGCQAVIEAIIEDAGAKAGLFGQLDRICPPDTLFATNTSSLSVTLLARAVKNPQRMIGMHFFNPPHLMPLVEVIAGHRTSGETVGQAITLAQRMKKTPVLVRDSPGFIVNRCARPFYGEALRLLAEGIAPVEDIDKIVRSEGGFRMGPFELMDMIGIDINLAVTESIYRQTFGEPRFRPHQIQQKMVDSGLLGRKSGRGFYDYKS